MIRAQALKLTATRYSQLCKFSSINGNGFENGKSTQVELPPEPTNCCMSGCHNCVWVQYAADLTKLLNDGGEQAREIVLEKISDPSLKMFLRMELQNLDSKKDPPAE